MANKKSEFINTVELKVKDISSEFIKTAVISAIAYDEETDGTTFTVDTVKGFVSGDNIYIADGSDTIYIQILEIDIPNKKIIITGDYSTVKKGAALKKTDSIFYVEEALQIYSRYKPLNKTKTVSGTGTKEYDLPEDWAACLSQVTSLKLNSIALINELDYSIDLNEDGELKLIFRYEVSAESTFVIKYTTQHLFSIAENETEYTSSTPPVDFYAICNIGAYLYLMGLATRYGQSVSSLIKADSVNYDNKTDAFRRLAKEYLGQAASWLGISIKTLDGSETTQLPASVSDETQESNSLLSHGRDFTIYPNDNLII